MNMIEGESLKRYRVLYGGEAIGDWETAGEAWKGYREYEDLIRPVTDRGRKYRYQFFDGQNELDLIQFKNATKAEERIRQKTEE
jgi:hypothetical protein